MTTFKFGKWGENQTLFFIDVTNNNKEYFAEIRKLIAKPNFNSIPFGENHYIETKQIVNINHNEFISILFNKNKPKTTAKNILLKNGFGRF